MKKSESNKDAKTKQFTVPDSQHSSSGNQKSEQKCMMLNYEKILMTVDQNLQNY